MESGTKVQAGGASIGFGTILFVVFLVLKLTGYIDWRWLWVTAPLWMSAAFYLFVLVFIGLVVEAVVVLLAGRR